jgi:hypothetical protein
LLKRSNIITVTLAVLLVPALVFSAEKVAPGAAVAGVDNTVIVPLVIENESDLMALDIPLKFSEGVTLKEVTFENTVVEHFDAKLSKIDNEANTVVIGLIHQLSATPRSTVDAGEGAVANLVFEIDDPSITEIKLEDAKETTPAHRLTFVYMRRSTPDQIPLDQAHPEFGSVSVALAGMVGDGLPTTYSLEQNYPNPFNPSTEFHYSLPAQSDVKIEIFNVLGQRVRTLVNQDMPAGNHSVTWYGDNAEGNAVASGVYFYRISANSFTETKKMMLLK